MTYTHFTEEQLNEIGAYFGLTPVETLPVRDGRVSKTCKVWWRGEYGPEHVCADEQDHWQNIRNYPDAYQIKKPVTRVVYED